VCFRCHYCSGPARVVKRPYRFHRTSLVNLLSMAFCVGAHCAGRVTALIVGVFRAWYAVAKGAAEVDEKTVTWHQVRPTAARTRQRCSLAANVRLEVCLTLSSPDCLTVRTVWADTVRPLTPTPVPGQDAYYWPLTPAKCVTVWVAIDDVSAENGPISRGR
jgi:hypothetical protein